MILELFLIKYGEIFGREKIFCEKRNKSASNFKIRENRIWKNKIWGFSIRKEGLNGTEIFWRNW